jgi:hypothetical protein
MEAMKAENFMHERRGEALAYGASAFNKLLDEL